MRLLLDTHAFLWAAGNPGMLGKRSRALIEDGNNEVVVSAAVAWEIAIKHALRKLSLPLDPISYVPARLSALGFTPLAITVDPFDRVMVAQAQIEGLTFVTRDPIVAKYRVKTQRATQ